MLPEGVIGPVHTAVLKLIRESATARGGEIAEKIAKLSDRQLLKTMFANLRTGGDGVLRGLRLSQVGLVTMQHFFRAFECKMPEDGKLSAPELLYLDSKSRLPYHASENGFVIFETELGVKLKLAEGRISTLIEIEGGWKDTG